ncbi:cation diffusion facilitator family transporter [Gimesia sp.]|uniref:cation diffusion facilitator family transporter n=1 Tax=Gimesia sp. TaxID=2024833 RepID=UPI000C4B72FB|nr:cation diffusion facilitator family transporter [Gimesia sp.]MAX35671.1 cation transporter [Gimesia sp.]HAH47712.1 cation transporter [Planctomycetaceae bacterium]|tara:strand:+ start:1195 stop:2148 length:954 start_codon:yes stop_codon:yes gene_type:complete
MSSKSDEHSASHSHGLTRGEGLHSVSDLRLVWAVVLNQILTIAQVIAGIKSGSIALLSDAAHNFNDANALMIAYIARRISRKKANKRYTFGYRRAELIGAVINLTLLTIIGFYLIYEAILRFIEPNTIIGWLMGTAAVLALVVDIGTALLLWAMSKGSLNARTAFVHNLVDALGSVAVLLGAAVVIWYDWMWVDPLLTLLIATYILWQVAAMLPKAIRILMEGAPVDFDIDSMIGQLKQINGVDDIHHVHIWELDEQHRSLEAHILIQRARAVELEAIKTRIKNTLIHDFRIAHSTLEFELFDSGAHSQDTTTIIDH